MSDQDDIELRNYDEPEQPSSYAQAINMRDAMAALYRPNKTGGHVTRHGMNRRGKRAPEYGVWATMWSRCTNPKVRSWKTYGANGIGVCERWKSFEAFLADMGLRPSPRHTLERKQNHLGYSPDNCCWATRSQQNRNTKRTRLVTRDGITLCLKDWCARLGVSYAMVKQRIEAYGWEIDTALTEPTNIKFRRTV